MPTLRTPLPCVFLTLALLLPAVAQAGSHDEACQKWTQQAIDDPAVGCDAACVQAMRLDKYHYRDGLAAAMASRDGLEKFVQYATRSSISGAGADQQACHLYALLLKWGDGPFSHAVAHVGPKAKERVSGLLDAITESDYKDRFPQTYGLASHHAP